MRVDHPHRCCGIPGDYKEFKAGPGFYLHFVAAHDPDLRKIKGLYADTEVALIKGWTLEKREWLKVVNKSLEQHEVERLWTMATVRKVSSSSYIRNMDAR